MPIDTIDIQVRGVFPGPESCAVFLGNLKKVFVIQVDPAVGQAIALAITPLKKDRPLTHDLLANILASFGIRYERVVINDALGGTFYARIILKMENELGVKLVEADARPSDAIVLALQLKKPIQIDAKLWDSLPDASDQMRKLPRN